MNSQVILYAFLHFIGVVIASFSQILLKKAADEKRKSLISQYLNLKVIIAYILFFGSAVLAIVAYKVIPITLGAVISALEYGIVAVLSYYLLKEPIAKKQIIGLIVVVSGILCCSL